MRTPDNTGPGPVSPDDLAGLSFERRRVPRYDTCGSAVADFGDGPDGHIIAGVELLDSSAAGLGFASPTPVAVGRDVRVYMGNSPVPGRTGRVARCDEKIGADGRITAYRIGLDTGPALAA